MHLCYKIGISLQFKSEFAFSKNLKTPAKLFPIMHENIFLFWIYFFVQLNLAQYYRALHILSCVPRLLLIQKNQATKIKAI
jgi:hypothetical protein